MPLSFRVTTRQSVLICMIDNVDKVSDILNIRYFNSIDLTVNILVSDSYVKTRKKHTNRYIFHSNREPDSSKEGN